jgi:hypothetical protein
MTSRPLINPRAKGVIMANPITAALSTNGATARWRPFTRKDLKPIIWLVDQLIPLGNFGILEGIPGSAKTTLLSHLCRCITTGEAFAGRKVLRGRIAFLGSEEAWCLTALRLLAAGCPEGSVGRIELVERSDGQEFEIPLTFPSCLPALQKQLEAQSKKDPKNPVRLLVLDTLSCAIDAGLDQYREADIRKAIMPLIRMCERYQVSLIGVRHATKAQPHALMSGLGGVAFFAAARFVLRMKLTKSKEFFLETIKATFIPNKPRFHVLLRTEIVELPDGGTQPIGVVERVESLTDALEQGHVDALSETAELIVDFYTALLKDKGSLSPADIAAAMAEKGWAYEGRDAKLARAYLQDEGHIQYNPKTNLWELIMASPQANGQPA